MANYKDLIDSLLKEEFDKVAPLLSQIQIKLPVELEKIKVIWIDMYENGLSFGDNMKALHEVISTDKDNAAICIFKYFQMSLLHYHLLKVNAILTSRRMDFDGDSLVQEMNQSISLYEEEATIEEAFEVISKLDKKLRRLLFAQTNNGILLNELIEKHEFDGFRSKLLETQSGIHELLVCCFLLNKIIKFRESLLQVNHVWEFSELLGVLFFMKMPRTNDDEIKLANHIVAIQDNLLKGENIDIQDVFENYQSYTTGCISLFSKDAIKFFKTFGDPLGYRLFINALCEKPYVEYILPIYFKTIEELGLSIETEVIDRCNKDHIIVAEAQKYLETQESSPVKKTKGRKKSSWIKTMTNCPEEVLGRLFRDEIWPGLKKRLQKFTYKDVNNIELRGKDLESAIEALGACFIYYVVDSLGYADRKWSSFEKTTIMFLSVSRNTISSYMKILDEYGRWLKKDQSNLDVFEHENPKYYKLLLNNLNSFNETISYLTPRIKKLFEDNLTMLSKG